MHGRGPEGEVGTPQEDRALSRSPQSEKLSEPTLIWLPHKTEGAQSGAWTQQWDRRGGLAKGQRGGGSAGGRRGELGVPQEDRAFT